ncbi:MAG: dipeptidase [candidate division KSB1 bacterium]|nr:dipeptidase [candidate division KSB1 bacterium]MDZ7303269.1 dipeptidase [candidate division KSB1 bacterium]MDZ7312573.1 dipeptidase [candidate division KSB1 bacterium]
MSQRNTNLGWLFLFLVIRFTVAPAQPTEDPLARQAAEIHARILTVDTHIDWPLHQFHDPGFNAAERHTPGTRISGQWDLIRMKEGGLDAVFMSIFTSQGPLTDAGYATAKKQALKLIELTKKMAADNPDLAEIALTPEDAYRIEQAGKRAIFMGMENGYPIGMDLDNVRQFYDLGVRYITLTHTKNNEIGDSSTDNKKVWNGLSPFGEQVVREMNRLGIMVDLSHVHDDTFWDVIALTKAPVIASHSSARALCDHPRNMNDAMLKAVKQNGGVVQVCLLGEYIKKMPPNPQREAALQPLQGKIAAWRQGRLSEEEIAKLREQYQAINAKFPPNRPTLQDAVDHIDHMVKVMGIDHVGIGSDFDGGGGLMGVDDVSEMPNLTKELLRRGYTEDDIRKIWGGNLMRVFREVQKIAQTLQQETTTQ